MGAVRAVSLERVETTIRVVRAQRVMLDADLAALYERFPADFMFQLSAAEFEILRSQLGTSSGWGGRRYRPYAFTEQGVAMLSSVLRSPRAVQVNIEIMRAFVRLREMLQANAELAKKLASLEKKYDAQFRVVFDAIRELMAAPVKSTKRIGFRAERP